MKRRTRTVQTSTSTSTTTAAAAWDGGVDLRTNAASVGLQAIRVAAAAARLLQDDDLNERDRRTLSSVSHSLREEARVLRHEINPDALDETAYAFAGVALSALSKSDEAATEEKAAGELDKLAETLEMMLPGQKTPDRPTLVEVHNVFLRASELVRITLSGPGEWLDGNREGFASGLAV